MSRKSVRYNNCFQLSSIQSEPTRERGGQGWVKRGGFGKARSMTIHGRIFHVIRDAATVGTVNWFVHAGAAADQVQQGVQIRSSAAIVGTIRRFLLHVNW